MSKKEIQKNFDAGAKFTEYAIKNPDILNNVPKNAQIVLVPEKSPVLAKKNISLGKKIIKTEKKPVVQAMQRGQKWELKPLEL